MSVAVNSDTTAMLVQEMIDTLLIGDTTAIPYSYIAGKLTVIVPANHTIDTVMYSPFTGTLFPDSWVEKKVDKVDELKLEGVWRDSTAKGDEIITISDGLIFSVQYHPEDSMIDTALMRFEATADSLFVQDSDSLFRVAYTLTETKLSITEGSNQMSFMRYTGPIPPKASGCKAATIRSKSYRSGATLSSPSPTTPPTP